LEPGPKRGEGTWDEFLKRHAATLWACDFFSKEVWTTKGLVEVFVLFIIQVGSRRVHRAGLTAHPDGRWMAQQARNLAMVFGEQADKPRFLLRDHNTKFTKQFDEILEAEGGDRTGPRALLRACERSGFLTEKGWKRPERCRPPFVVDTPPRRDTSPE
jgi:hypothetical protein